MHADFHSRHLPDNRDIIVYLPPGYDKQPERRYPVFYLHDGQNLFDEETAFCGREWRADETAEDLIQAGAIQPIIMVGIYNSPHRVDEYTPVPDVHGRSGGKAMLYEAMIVEELKPQIDALYRTLTGPEHTALGGSSLGGLATVHIGLRRPEVFGKLAVLSPSVWWNRGSILRIIRDMPLREPRPRVWLDIGTAEGKYPGSILRDARYLRRVLLKRGWVEGRDLVYFEDAGAVHNEAAWGRRMPGILRFLFPASSEQYAQVRPPNPAERVVPLLSGAAPGGHSASEMLAAQLNNVLKIHIVTTGGTIEKVYSEQSGQVENVTAKIDRYLQSLRLPDAKIEITPIMNKDSLEMTAEDRELILAVVRVKASAGPVVITHGTDTMVETGRLLKAGLGDLRHSVILTGAMTPLGFERSDGLQNLTESLFAARVLPPGVWIAIHNQVFDVDRVRKDRENARFVAT